MIDMSSEAESVHFDSVSNYEKLRQNDLISNLPV